MDAPKKYNLPSCTLYLSIYLVSSFCQCPPPFPFSSSITYTHNGIHTAFIIGAKTCLPHHFILVCKALFL